MKLQKIVNLTPHAINIRTDREIEIPPSGIIARCEEKTEAVDNIEYQNSVIPVIQKRLGCVTNLPPPEEGTVYIVSMAVAQACPERKDVLTIGEPIRDEKGRIIGASSLATFSA